MPSCPSASSKNRSEPTGTSLKSSTVILPRGCPSELMSKKICSARVGPTQHRVGCLIMEVHMYHRRKLLSALINVLCLVMAQDHWWSLLAVQESMYEWSTKTQNKATIL